MQEYGDEKKRNKLVEWKALVDTVGIKSADLEDKSLFQWFAAFRTAQMQGKATNCHTLFRMIRVIKVSNDWFGCGLVTSFYVAKVFSEFFFIRW